MIIANLEVKTKQNGKGKGGHKVELEIPMAGGAGAEGPGGEIPPFRSVIVGIVDEETSK